MYGIPVSKQSGFYDKLSYCLLPQIPKTYFGRKNKKRLEEIMNDVAQRNGWEIISKEIMSDHMHFFVSADTQTKPHIVVKRFKGRSSRFLRNEFPELLKMPTLWTHLYFISTTGNVSAAVIKKYIEQQWDKV